MLNEDQMLSFQLSSLFECQTSEVHFCRSIFYTEKKLILNLLGCLLLLAQKLILNLLGWC